jgi:hypothetical protein
MKLSTKILVLVLSAFTCSADLTRQVCVDQGGVVVGDIGNGAIFEEGYVCPTDGLPPIDVVVAGPGEPMAIEGEVCCGGGSTNSDGVFRPEINADECAEQGGMIVNDIGDGSIHREDYVCQDTGVPPIGTVIPREGEPIAREGQVCCPVPNNSTSQREEYTREQCLANNGTIVGDIGDGAIFQETYLCESSGLPPLGNIIQGEEPFAIEGEVCCESGLNMTLPAAMEAITREECSSLGGTIVGDIGNGAIFEATYTCESNGLPPIANIIQSEEPFAIEGEVCCGEEVDQTFTSARDEISRAECEAQGGEIVGDIGDGAVFADTYTCESNGQAPLANVVAGTSNDEPIANEGEVCCGPPDMRNELLQASQVNDADGASNLSLLYVICLIAGLFWIV